MALKIPLDMEIYRRPHWADPTNMGDRYNGCFMIPSRRTVIVVSNVDAWAHSEEFLHLCALTIIRLFEQGIVK